MGMAPQGKSWVTVEIKNNKRNPYLNTYQYELMYMNFFFDTNYQNIFEPELTSKIHKQINLQHELTKRICIQINGAMHISNYQSPFLLPK